MRIRCHSQITLLLLCLTIFLFACSGREARERLQEALLQDLLNASGWDREAAALPSGETVRQWMDRRVKEILGVSAEVEWQVVGLGDGHLVTAQAQRGSLRVIERWLAASNGRMTLLNADAATAWPLAVPLETSTSWTLQTRIFGLTRNSKQQVIFEWRGCLVNDTPNAFRQIALRAVLLTNEPGNQAEGFRGKLRRSTARSGIPESLAPGDFFCTTLRSAPFPSGAPQKALGVVEAAWTVNGVGRFAPLASLALETESLDGKPLDAFAVVRGGELKTGGDSLTLSDPSLVRVLSRQGLSLEIQTLAGQRGWLRPERIVGLFPPTQPELDAHLRGLLETLLRLAAKGRFDQAAELFEAGSDLLSGEALQNDLRRRFPFPEAGTEALPKFHLLEVKPQGKRQWVSYFVWLPLPDKTMAQTFDTILFDMGPKGWRFVAPQKWDKRTEVSRR